MIYTSMCVPKPYKHVSTSRKVCRGGGSFFSSLLKNASKWGSIEHENFQSQILSQFSNCCALNYTKIDYCYRCNKIPSLQLFLQIKNVILPLSPLFVQDSTQVMDECLVRKNMFEIISWGVIYVSWPKTEQPSPFPPQVLFCWCPEDILCIKAVVVYPCISWSCLW